MSLLKNIFRKKESIKSYEDFWRWFQKNEKNFFKIVSQNKDLEKNFFAILSEKLNELHDGFYYLTGMYDAETVELVFTVDGEIKKIVFVEELVNTAPDIKGWKFTAHKPELDIKNVNIKMGGFDFNAENLSFSYDINPDYPDEIEISVFHNELNEENKSMITEGIFIFLDNYLGELNFATNIDHLKVPGKDESQTEHIRIDKLKEYLVWRQKEFIEKYEGLRHNTENDNYSLLELEMEAGEALAVINTDLLQWESKASHPWILEIEVKYNGHSKSGMPDDQTLELLEEIENDMMVELKDSEGYLNIGRQTGANTREVYFACKDFRKPSLVLHDITGRYSNKLDIKFEIFKDKYWQSLNRFNIHS